MVRRLAGTRAGHVDSLRHSPEPLAPPACVLVGDPTSPLSIIACSVHRATTSSTSRQAPPPMSVSRMSLTGAPLKRATADLFWLVPPGSVGSILRWPPGRLGRRASASASRDAGWRRVGVRIGARFATSRRPLRCWQSWTSRKGIGRIELRKWPPPPCQTQTRRHRRRLGEPLEAWARESLSTRQEAANPAVRAG